MVTIFKLNSIVNVMGKLNIELFLSYTKFFEKDWYDFGAGFYDPGLDYLLAQ